MKEVNLYSKILHNGGIYDTKKYRYRINIHNGNIERCDLEYLDICIPEHFARWQPWNKKYEELY